MIIRVQPGLGVPIYLQIESQVKHAIAAGALKLDNALPSVRKLAAELRVNPNTVARAYQNLERDGILRTVPGGGCYVSSQSPGLLKSEPRFAPAGSVRASLGAALWGSQRSGDGRQHPGTAARHAI